MVRELPRQLVLIVGGGLGGLALANGLQSAGVPFHVFESDPSVDFRAQGYRLKINRDGADGLKSVLTQKKWAYFEETCVKAEAGETDFNATDAAITCSRAGAGARGGMPTWTCDRGILRNILLDGLEGHISFSKRLVKFESDNEVVRIHFADGTSAEGSFLVGADGVRSAVRRQFLPDQRPVDTGGSCIYGKTPITAELKERFPQRAMRWMTLIQDRTPITQTLDIDETPITLLLEPIVFPENAHRQKLPGDYMYWVLIARTSLFGMDQRDFLRLDGQQAAALSLKMTEEWHPSFRSLFHLQDLKQTSTLHVASALPDIPAWEPSAQVTLLGDAIHAMSPCGGIGAATALRDAGKLAKIISQDGVSKDRIGAYEMDMRAFARASIQRSFFGGRKMFAQRPFEECAALQI